MLPDFPVNCGSFLLIFEDIKQCTFTLTMVKNFNKYKTDFKLKCEEQLNTDLFITKDKNDTSLLI